MLTLFKDINIRDNFKTSARKKNCKNKPRKLEKERKKQYKRNIRDKYNNLVEGRRENETQLKKIQ